MSFLPMFEVERRVNQIFPEDCRFSKDHRWVRMEGDRARVGITHYAAGIHACIVQVELPPVGRVLTRGEEFGTVESSKTISSLKPPLSGEVLEVNVKLEMNPDIICRDPYGEGWMIALRISNPAELDDLLSAEDYRRYLYETVR